MEKVGKNKVPIGFEGAHKGLIEPCGHQWRFASRPERTFF